MDGVIGQSRQQQGVHVGAVGGEIRRPELRRGDGFQRLAKAQMPIVGRDRHDIRRLGRQRPQPLLDPERAQHFDRVRSELQSGADLAQLRRTLVDLHLEALFA